MRTTKRKIPTRPRLDRTLDSRTSLVTLYSSVRYSLFRYGTHDIMATVAMKVSMHTAANSIAGNDNLRTRDQKIVMHIP